MNKQTKGADKAKLGRRVGPTQAADVEYFCRACKGHYSRIVPVESLLQTSCRCGSRDLLIYNVSGEAAAPLRSN
jgi:hypothetical protein